MHADIIMIKILGLKPISLSVPGLISFRLQMSERE